LPAVQGALRPPPQIHLETPVDLVFWFLTLAAHTLVVRFRKARNIVAAAAKSNRPHRLRPAYPSSSKLASRLEDLGDVARHLHLVPDAAHHPFPVKQKGATFDAHIFASVHALFDPSAIFLANIGARIGGEDER